MTVWEFRRLVRENRSLMLEHDRCPLGAGLGVGHYETRPACGWASDTLGLDTDYCFGVAMGFDGERDWNTPEEAMLGHRFGKRMRVIAGLTED
jgi:hypothetical protein